MSNYLRPLASLKIAKLEMGRSGVQHQSGAGPHPTPVGRARRNCRRISRHRAALIANAGKSMPLLSICIPHQDQAHGLDTLLGALLADKSLDLEILVADGPDLTAFSGDARLKRIPAPGPETPQQIVWSSLIEASTGNWVTLVNPEDMIEPELAIMLEFVESANPAVDALAWHSLQIDANDPPERRFSVAIPSKYDIINLDKAAMLKAFFMWENSLNVPRMPFGLYHAALKRTLAMTVVESLKGSGRVSPLPVYEWAARAIFLCNEIAFCERPMSVISKRPFAADPLAKPTPGFPFHSGIGQTAGIAEVQNAVFAEMGAQWGGGAEAAFVRAVTIDCMMETDTDAFTRKCEAYFKALRLWNGGQLASQFNPHFSGPQTPDIRRGLHGNMLMVDRFIGKARNAQDFYRVMRSFLVPVRVICGSGVAA
jgi:hypothetical protein